MKLFTKVMAAALLSTALSGASMATDLSTLDKDLGPDALKAALHMVTTDGLNVKVTFSADNKKILVTNAPKTGQLKNSKYCNVCPTVHFSLANCFNKVNLISFDSHHDLRVTAQNIKNTFKVS